VSFRRWLIVLLSFAAALGVSAYIARSAVPEGDIPLRLAWWAHAVALAGMAGEIGLRALKVSLSGRALGVPFGFVTALRMSLGGDFGAAITPSRSGAEPARFLVLAEAGCTPAGILLVLFTELVLETISLVLIALLVLGVFGFEGRAPASIAGLVGGYAATVLAVGAGGYLLARHAANGPPPAWARALRLNPSRWRTVQRALRSLRDGVTGLRHANLALMTGSLAASVGHILARLAILPAIVVGLGVPLANVDVARLVTWPIVLLYGGAAAPAPAGGGLIEMAFRGALGATIPDAIFGATLLWWRVYTFYGYIPLGALAAGATVLRAVRGRSRDPRSVTEVALQAASPS
jgi:glycosyltransferase 2 family protein